MSDKNLDDTFASISRKQPDTGKLSKLESDVWNRIYLCETTWQQKIITVLIMPRFQASALALALILGISVSPLLMSGYLPDPEAESEVFNLGIFGKNNPYLAANLIDRIK